MQIKRVNHSLPPGFTLIEILIAITILSGIVFAVSMLGLDIFDYGIFLGENLNAQNELQATLRVMTSEIRAMNQSVVGSYALESASQNAIIFYSDVDGDGLVDRVRYFLDGNIFKKGVIEPSGSPLAYSGAEKITEEIHNIYAPAGDIFSYYGNSYTGTEVALAFPVNISLVRLIRLNITADQTPADLQSRINLSSSISIRNM